MGPGGVGPVPVYLQPLRQLSPMKWATEGLLAEEFRSDTTQERVTGGIGRKRSSVLIIILLCVLLLVSQFLQRRQQRGSEGEVIMQKLGLSEFIQLINTSDNLVDIHILYY